ncbi:MAG: pirin family protein [Gammaproteobacteria bacterium]|nr:pirin family protein [Gammaproteobacteria bacterium]
MNHDSTSTRLIPAVTVSEGAGVTVQRTIGTASLRNFDPFMLLDFFGSDNSDDYIAGFPSHPHRGFSTFTYMIDGHMEHKDSMGNTGNLGPGSAQLMKAASGVIHSEMPKQEAGLLRGFQLWTNLPAAHKMDHPEYQEYAAEDFPVIENQDYRARLLIGSLGDVSAPIVDDVTRVSYFDVEVEAGRRFQHDLPAEHNSFLYLFEGDGVLNDARVPGNTLAALGGDDYKINFTAGDSGARFILTSGLPINEPVAQYGPFVMNTRDEIEESVRDFRSNNFIRHKARIRGQQNVAGQE